MAILYYPRGVGECLVLCLAADNKPTVSDGFTLIEVDTGKFFQRESAAWVEKFNSAYDVAGAAAAAQSASEPAGTVATHAAASDPHPGYLTPAEGNAAYDAIGLAAAAYAAAIAASQPLSSTLTTLASSTAAGLALMDDADAAAQRTTLVLGNVTNTSDANKPVSTAQQTALDLKANLSLLSAFSQSYLDDANEAAFKATVNLEPGVDMAALSHSHAESDVTNLATDLAAKQATLVSGTNIKTINGSTVLGSGDLVVGGITPKRVVGMVFDGGGSPPTVGSIGYIVVPYSGTIDRWDIIADQSGNAVVDVWKAAGAVPTDANRIAGTEKPTLSAQQLANDTSLTTWSTLAVTAGDVFGFELESVATCTRITAEVRIQES